MSCCARREFGSCFLCLYTRVPTIDCETATVRVVCCSAPLVLAIRVQIEGREVHWLLETVRATTDEQRENLVEQCRCEMGSEARYIQLSRYLELSIFVESEQ